MAKAISSSSLAGNPVYPVMFAIGGCHLLNDSLQSVIPAMFPILEADLGLTFTQLGLIAFVLNIVASVLQPVVGFISDKKPMPFALPLGMTSSFIGIAGLAFAPEYWMILVSVIFLGLGSAVFHPEGSRVSYMAAGSKRGLSQSIYQVGGNSGQALAPLISAFILVPLGQIGAALFLFVAALGIFILSRISIWYKQQLEQEKLQKVKKVLLSSLPEMTKKQVGIALALLMIIIFARSFYVTNMTSFYIFHLIESYGLTIQLGQLYVFLFLGVGAAGTFFGGPMADKIGRKNVILLSIVVPIPLAALLPYLPLHAVLIFLALIGFFIMLSFSVTVVYAQELVPSKIGTMAGLTVGLAFGMGAIGAVVIGILMDSIGVYETMVVVSFLPIIALVGLWLPRDRKIVAAS
ncbi:FSR family fosmidomycin resistance protein-like MFS transporter [Planomicrobium stackebrandtii]|uniref:FSR family fosmidomycin resistance protein-like MFS transporter n=1 Tax=Planomicrobium stackebrandtii TaxID=253160 RepID=A0ABU0H1S9_9BACL|nr:MFS transporter [Planomicrobium stackebrandtii]MDQ0430717.1 FSR family fosmidomycin resistance protein-like MFS transporter [Planomicrobium stackebrandtii]